jgi:hypothetical protein
MKKHENCCILLARKKRDLNEYQYKMETSPAKKDETCCILMQTSTDDNRLPDLTLRSEGVLQGCMHGRRKDAWLYRMGRCIDVNVLYSIVC